MQMHAITTPFATNDTAVMEPANEAGTQPAKRSERQPVRKPASEAIASPWYDNAAALRGL